ncbi:MAG TPA: carbohydrate-binding protein, partial [Verrucomicrobia bacterium]|nr:carbohydrate-binding protein [Verrucomicrobiota bacterium]
GGLTRVAWNGPGVTLDFYPEDFRGKHRLDKITLESRTDSQGNFATYFETPNSGDINVAPEGDFFGDYAVILYGFLHPAETGTYRFALAADDYAALYLSTDEDPANTVLIASEPEWNPVRSFGSTDRRPNGENLSAGVELEAGQKYYVEAIMKEAGGGDNIAVAWKGPGDDSAFADGDLPIGGEFLSGFLPPVPGTVYVEAEDFDFDGGMWIAGGDTGLNGPYVGNAYDGKGGIQGVDFDGAGSTRAYRITEDPAPSIDKLSGPDDVRNARDGFIVESNWIMGWNDAGDWTNYTRDFSHGSYWVSGDFSSGGADISVQLDLVTEGAGTDAQTLGKLGEFNGAATGNWDVFAPIQLADDSGNPAVISLGGVQTLRLTTLPGNMDVNFLKFTPKQALYIEAEDFDFDGGSWIAGGTGFDGPYPGNAYNGLGGTQGIDFDGAGSTRAYRTTGDPGPSIDKESAPGDVRNVRDGFELESNWILGWNDPGDWTNYTRDFPEDNYEVVGMFSSGGSDISAQLDIVVDGAGTDSQTLEKLGEFNGAATGNWDVFAPIQLSDDNGNPAVLSLAGVQTLRVTTLPGNMDWNFIKFFPSVGGGGGAEPGESISISTDADGNVVVTWTGLLQSATDVTGPWTDVSDDSASPLTLTPDQARLFGRAVAP